MNYQEYREEAERLSRTLRRSVDVASTICDCDYHKNCGRCWGSGTYYELVFSFCSHLVKDGEEDECDLSFCREQEHARAELDLEETVARVSAPIKSCFEVQSERDEMEAA